MRTRFPRISALLEETAEEATWVGIRRLVANKTPEHFDLDFKRDLYEDPEKNNAPESSKKYNLPEDISAMANSGGGIILLGVDAPPPDGVAKNETPVVLSDETERRFRQRVASNVFPMVDWQIRRVPIEGETAKGFYLLLVPSSAIAPHAVVRDSSLRYLVRDQHTNRPLSEAEVARRYRYRFDLAQSRRDRVQEIHRNGLQLWGSPSKVFVQIGITPLVEGELPMNRQTFDALEERVKLRASRDGDILNPYGADVTVCVRHRHLRAFAGRPNTGLNYVLDFHSDGSFFWVKHLPTQSRTVDQTQREMVTERSICSALAQALFEFPRWIVERGRLNGDALLRVTVSRGGRAVALERAGDPYFVELREPLPAISDDIVVDEVVNLDSLSDKTERGRLILQLLTEIVQAFGKIAPESVIEKNGAPSWDDMRPDLVKLMGFG